MKTSRIIALSVALPIIVMLVAAVIAAPYVATWFVNRDLAALPEYRGQIQDLSIHPFRGAATVRGFTLVKRGEKLAPWLAIHSVEVQISMKHFLKGHILLNIKAEEPAIHIIVGTTKASTQTAPSKEVTDRLMAMLPYDVNEATVDHGMVRFEDRSSHPHIDLVMDDIALHVTGISDHPHPKQDIALPTKITLTARVLQLGSMKLIAGLDHFSVPPRFDGDIAVVHVPLVRLAQFTRAHGGFDFARGTIEMFGEAKLSNGKITGYVKPMIANMAVFDKTSAGDKNDTTMEMVWEKFVENVFLIFQNNESKRIATRIPISGQLDNPQASPWGALGKAVSNAFVTALLPGVEHTVTIDAVLEGRRARAKAQHVN